MIHGIPRPQPIHKGKTIPSKWLPSGEFTPLGCGYAIYGSEADRHFLWSEDWSEVTCKKCLVYAPKAEVDAEA